MIDFKDLIKNKEEAKKGLIKKGLDVEFVNEIIDKTIRAHNNYVSVRQQLDEIRGDSKKTSKIFGPKAVLDDGKPETFREEGKRRRKDKQTFQKSANHYLRERDKWANQIPNWHLMTDALKGGEENNKPISDPIGKIPNIENPKDHIQLGKDLDIIDIERGVKTSGSRFYFLKNQAVELEFALIQWVMVLLKKEKFELLITPQLVQEKVMLAGGYMGQAENEIYKITNLPNIKMEHNHHFCTECKKFTTVPGVKDYFYQGDNPKPLVKCCKCGEMFPSGIAFSQLYLIGTSEQSVLGYHMNELIVVPKRYAAFSTCFRREAGSYGKDTKGIIRTHQFDKIEMFSFVEPKDSTREHKKLIKLEEKILKELEIPYQKVLVAAGDLGMSAAKKIDLESWIPSQKSYRETHSCSNCTDWQARRANIRFKNKDGKNEFVHTINGTAIAIGRLLVALLENHQQKDGSINIPKVLHKYLSFKKIK